MLGGWVPTHLTLSLTDNLQVYSNSSINHGTFLKVCIAPLYEKGGGIGSYNML